MLSVSGLRCRILPVAALFAFAVTVASQAQVVIPGPPKVGSSNPVSAEPLVPRPSTTPCVVKLFTNEEFANFSAQTFSYAPPADCHGPWAKVVFTADFTVTAGVQYDRTAEFFLGHANIYYGTTSEPGTTLSPSWHVERDVTDLSAIFDSPQTGEADLGNLVNSTYTGIIYANAALEFYPVSKWEPAPVVPDVVVPLPDAAGGAAALGTTASQLTQSVTLPTNVERVFMDVVAQSQSNDEFWYSCVPNDVTSQLESCGSTGFRETEISIDGKAAGIAPVYPWIYTGGIDPFLWIPITGVQTLDFKPYRVDLTPFAGILGDGKSHTVALSVFNADSYFLVTANLLAYIDKGSDVVTGHLLYDNLTAAPTPTVTEKLNLDSSGNGTASVSVSSVRNFITRGNVYTSHGKVTTTIVQNVDFENDQNFTLSDTTYIQSIRQKSVVDTFTETITPEGKNIARQHVDYPFALDINVEVAPDGSETQTTTSDQNYITSLSLAGLVPNYNNYVDEEVKSADTLEFDASGDFTGNTGAKSSATDFEYDNRGYIYYRGLTSKGNVLTGITDKP
jgi:hypothetical protein